MAGKMLSLETQVREALIEQRVNESVRVASEIPGYTTMVMEMVEEVGEAMFNSIGPLFSDADKEGIEKMRREYRENGLPQIRAQFEDPEQLRKQMYEQARNEYMSHRQFKAILRPHFAELKKDGEVGTEVVEKYAQAYEGFSTFLRTNDKIVRGLTKIAEKEGVDKAVDKETRYTLIRKMFPRAESYRDFTARRVEASKQFFQQAQSALSQGGETEQMMVGMLGAISPVFEKATKLVERVQGNYLEKTIKEIYG